MSETPYDRAILEEIRKQTTALERITTALIEMSEAQKRMATKGLPR